MTRINANHPADNATANDTNMLDLFESHVMLLHTLSSYCN